MLEHAAADGKVAIETADLSLSKREQCVGNLQSEKRELEGTDMVEVVLETPCKLSTGAPCVDDKVSAFEKFRNSISAIDFSFSTNSPERETTKSSSRKVGNYHGDSSGVVADCESEDLSDNEVFFEKIVKTSNSGVVKNSVESLSMKNNGSYEDHLSVEYSGSDLSDGGQSPLIKKQPVQIPKSFDFTMATKSHTSSYFQVHKPLNDSRVLQLILTPLKNKMVIKHTKSSILRLKNSPSKDPTRGRECQKMSRRSLRMGKDVSVDAKRKCADATESDESDMNTSKRRKVVEGKQKQKWKTTKTKPVHTNKMCQKYNLRTRR